MEQHIKGHNRNVIEKSTHKNRGSEGCNCQKRNLPCFAGGTEEAPQGNCKVECVVYQAEVNSDIPATNEKEKVMRYIGITEGPLKTRYTNHQSDMTTTTKKKRWYNIIWSYMGA